MIRSPAALAALLLAAPASGANLVTLHTFPPGASPAGNLVVSFANTGDTFFGTTQSGAYGQVYRFAYDGGTPTFQPIWQFRPGPLGYSPGPGLTGTPAQLFGATEERPQGENPGCGAVFSLTQQSDGTYAGASLGDLNNSNKGCQAVTPVNLAANGNVFVLFPSGGATQGGYGSILRFHPRAGNPAKYNEQLLYSFRNRQDGLYPSVPMLLGQDGALYGTAIPSSYPKRFPTPVWRLAPPPHGLSVWQFSLIAQLGAEQCAAQIAPMIQGPDGTIYAACPQTPNGTPDQYGNIFSLTPPAGGQGFWTYTKLYRFRGAGDGAYPMTALTLDANGNLFGTTSRGHGTVWELQKPGGAGQNWTFHTVWTFSVGDGDHPSSPLAIDAAGDLFGTTSAGGVSDGGTLFQIAP